MASPAVSLAATDPGILRRTLWLPSSKQHFDRRDQNTNSLITPVKLFVDICSQSHSSFHSVQQQLNGPQREKKQKKQENRGGKKITADDI